jgi:hypothetical protein
MISIVFAIITGAAILRFAFTASLPPSQHSD